MHSLRTVGSPAQSQIYIQLSCKIKLAVAVHGTAYVPCMFGCQVSDATSYCSRQTTACLLVVDVPVYKRTVIDGHLQSVSYI